jgi:transposase
MKIIDSRSASRRAPPQAGPAGGPAMIDRHWSGIAAYCKPQNKVALGFVEGFNNKVRVSQRRAYGLRDEEYLRLKILTWMLPPI